MERSHKRLEGILPKKVEIGSWTPAKLEAFFQFANFFMKQVDGKFVYDVSDENIATAYERTDEYWIEFLHRLAPKGIEENKAKRLNAFRTRLMNFIRTVGAWLKANPHAIFPELETVMRENPRFSWAVDTFAMEESGIGDMIVVPANQETTDPTQANHNPHQTARQIPQIQYQNTLAKAVSLLSELVGSIDRAQLKGLPTEKKLRIALQMIDTLGKTMKDSPQAKSVFNTLILQKGGREDLEKSIMSYVTPE